MTIADVIHNVVNKHLYGMPCENCKINPYFLAYYANDCGYPTANLIDPCTPFTVTNNCTAAITVTSFTCTTPTITIS